jgi:hypothetical protein
MYNLVLYRTDEFWINIHPSWQIEYTVEDTAYNYTVNTGIATIFKKL